MIRFTQIIRMAVSSLILLTVVFLLIPAVSHGVNITVNSTVDPGDGTCDMVECTLREAVVQANMVAGPDVITFQAGLMGTIVLTGTDIAIQDDLTITGPGADMITVSGGNTLRVFNIHYNSFVCGNVMISGLKFIDGSAVAFQTGDGTNYPQQINTDPQLINNLST
jgi:CSLREA domain-containing protein